MIRHISAIVVCAVVLAGCSDSATPTAIEPSANMEALSGFPIFDHYVAMGTSISQGNASSGVVGASQYQSWVAQLSRRAGHPMTLPMILQYGCAAPYDVPLIKFTRTSGEPITLPSDLQICSPLAEGITLPTQNVAISGAKTSDALVMTPELKPDIYGKQLYQRVLPSNTTQVGAMKMQNPKLVSIEFGANEVLPAVSGVAIPGVTLVPFPVWAPQFHALVDTAAMFAKKGVLVSLITDVASFPGMRKGDEIWRDRNTLLTAFNVAVSSDCTASVNLVFVPARIPAAVAAGLTNRAKGLPPVPFSCSDGGFGVVDYILTPSEAGIVNALMAQMNAEVVIVAAQHGYAHFELDALYGRRDIKGPYSSYEQMMSKHPYGPFVSFDGIHPSTIGQGVLADAAAEALNTTYRIGLAASGFIASR